MSRPIIVSVEAAIASGKSTLLNLLEHRMGKKVLVVQEPVREWQKVEGNEEHNILGLFYQDMNRWSYSFQMYALLTNFRVVEDAVNTLRAQGRSHDTIIVVERSPETCKHMFARMLCDSGHISNVEWATYTTWWDMMVTTAPKFDGHIYIRTSVDTVMGRLAKRNRGEECGVTRTYQSDLIGRHEKWVEDLMEDSSRSMLIIDGESNFAENVDDMDMTVDQVEAFFGALKDRACPPTPETTCDTPERNLV